jgi:acyl-CoA synthetase (AMP-forming)/AMP-acid ligase II
MAQNPYNTDLDRNPANYQPLTPLTFLERAASVFPDQTAIVHGGLRRSYASFYTRARQLGSALGQVGMGRGDTVSVMLANTPAMLECHYGVPMCGAVLHSINTRLDAAIIAFQLDHAMVAVVIVDCEFMGLMQKALELATVTPRVIQYDDPEYDSAPTATDAQDYEAFLAGGDPDFDWLMPEDEWDAISINYTSGTTGDPKGVVSHHRGAYLLAQGICADRIHAKTRSLSVDAADVSLQWLVFSLDDVGHCRHARLFASGPCRTDLGIAGRPWRHPSLRRADCDVFDSVRHPGGQARPGPPCAVFHRCCASARKSLGRHARSWF